MRDFSAVNARARGLSTHLLGRRDLLSLAAVEPAGLPLALSSRQLHAGGELPLEAFDEGLRRSLAAHVTTLARWDGASAVLEFLGAEADRRSLRALLRGALGGVPAQARLAATTPTHTLPEPVLAALARQPTPSAVIKHLVAIEHPDAGPLALVAHDQAQPELFALERALLAGFARRATLAAARGDEVLRDVAAGEIDVGNLCAAATVSSGSGVAPDDCFVEGGRHLRREQFRSLARPGLTLEQARRVLRETPLLELLGAVPLDARRIEARRRTHLLRSLRRAARQMPLSAAPTLWFLFALEAQRRDLRRVVWGALHGTPPGLTEAGLVTP